MRDYTPTPASHAASHAASSTLVTTAFIRLPRSEAKHPYSLERTVLVPADYVAYCSNSTSSDVRQPSACATIQRSRATARGRWNATVRTELHATTHAQLVDMIAEGVGLPAATLLAGAERSVHPLHCPSAEIILIWLAKPFLVRATVISHHDHKGLFAWVDAGFNVYQMRLFGPPPPPWLTFQPTHGRLAIAREHGACHNSLHGTNRTRCIVATYLYGSRSAWQTFVQLYARRLRGLLVGRAVGFDAPKPLCTEQDLYEDVASVAPELFDEFDVSQPWGWVNPRPHEEIKHGIRQSHGGRPCVSVCNR